MTKVVDVRLIVVGSGLNLFPGPGDHGITITTAGAMKDPLEEIPTDETDTALVPHPDGEGGVVWGVDATSAGSRPPYTVVVAPAGADAALQAIADYVCDGTDDQDEINDAIADAVATTASASVLMLDGDYTITDAIDFAALAGQRLVFEASGAHIVAGANLTTMISLAPAAGDQILAALDLRLGRLDGQKGTYTVTQMVLARRFSDNLVRIADIYNASGHGLRLDQTGVSDFGCFNNQFQIGRFNELDGTAVYATADATVYGVEGNIFQVGQVAYNGNGFIFGANTNDSVRFNTVIASPIEHSDDHAVYDRGGGNIWILNNTNNNPDGIGCPASMARRSTFIVYADGDPIEAAVIAQHFVLDKGAFRGLVELAEQSSVPGTPGSGFGRIYFKTDGKAYAKDDAGTEYDLTASGGGVTGFATPAIALGTAAASGAATTVIRSDATIVAFDATTPPAVGTAATGVAAVAARRDHVHATGAGTPSTQALGDAAATGSGPAAAMTDHKHAMPAFGSPVAVGSANADGAATTVARSDHVHQGAVGSDDHIHVVGEALTGDGAATVFLLANEAIPNTVIAYSNGVRLDVTLGAMNDQITFGAAPNAGAAVRVDYIPLQA